MTNLDYSVTAMFDYTIFYKETLPLAGSWDDSYDLFISAYNASDRVPYVFKKVKAEDKRWLALPDYRFTASELPRAGHIFRNDTKREAEYVMAFFDSGNFPLDTMHICVDITGFIKPYMMFLLKYLMLSGVTKVDVLFSEPSHYVKKEMTAFSDEKVLEVRQVEGFEGAHRSETHNDMLIIGAGYDHQLMMHVAEHKDNARKKIRIFGFPSLRLDMYQQNILRSSLVDNTFGSSSSADGIDSFLAPANDPFVTASVLSRIYKHETAAKGITNLYLSPLATKPQALGFTIFYLLDLVDEPASMIYPFCDSHSKRTSKGISRVWRYTVEFPE